MIYCLFLGFHMHFYGAAVPGGRRPGQAPRGAGGGAGGDQSTSGQHHWTESALHKCRLWKYMMMQQ